MFALWEALLEFAGKIEPVVQQCQFEVHIVDQSDSESNALEEFNKAADSPVFCGLVQSVSSTNPLFVCKSARGRCNPFRRWDTYSEEATKKEANPLSRSLGPQTAADSKFATATLSVKEASTVTKMSASGPFASTNSSTVKSQDSKESSSKVSLGGQVSKQPSHGAFGAYIGVTTKASKPGPLASNTAPTPPHSLFNAKPNATATTSAATALMTSASSSTAASASIKSSAPVPVPPPPIATFYSRAFKPHFAGAEAVSLVGQPPENVPASCLEDVPIREVFTDGNLNAGQKGTSALRVFVYTADLTRVLVDSLAVPSDGELNTGGGLARALLATTGPGVNSALVAFKKSRNGSSS